MSEPKNLHTFHIPVMGIGFTIDTPVKVAHYGITSVMSLVDDILVEKMREFYSKKLNLPFQAITEKDGDHRARRITEYLNLIDKIVHDKFAELKRSFGEKSEELQKYIDMLPDFSAIKKQFQEHSMHKEYLALVYGKLSHESGTINLPIGRNSRGSMSAHVAATKDDKPAITHYETLQHFLHTTLLRVRTETGRTHQIRTHLLAIGHPIVGDPLYKIKKSHIIDAPRLFLHATNLGFTHPTTDQWMEFDSPLPEELENMLKMQRL